MVKNKDKLLNLLGPLARKKLRLAQAVTAVLTIFVVLGIFTPASWPQKARAATLTWDGGGADNNWSTCANWSTDTCPVAGDTVTFNGTSVKDSIVDGDFGGSIGPLNISSGYTGTLSLARSLTVTGAFTQAAGNFTADGQTLDMNSSFTLSAGSFTASSTTTTLAGAMTISGSPTFAHNSGTWTFDGGTTATLSCNNVTFNLVTFNHTGANTKTVNSNCSLPLGSNPTIGNASDTAADITLNGVLSGSGTATIAARNGGNVFTINSGASLSGFSGIQAGGLTISGATISFGAFTTFDVNGSFILSSGASFTAPSGTATFASTFTLNSGTTFTHNSGTVTFDGTAAATLACNSTTFNLVTFAHTGSVAKTVSSDCSLPLGTSPTIGADGNADLTLSGTLSGTGTLTTGIATGTGNALTINSSGALSGFSGLLAGSLSITGATLDFGIYTTFDINGNFTLSSSANFTAPSGTAFFAIGFTLNSGTTFTHNNGTVTFDGTQNATLACNNTTFNLVAFSHISNTKTVNSDCSFPLGSDPTASAGGDISLRGTLSGSGTLTIGSSGSTSTDLGLVTSGVLSGFSGLVTNGDFTVTDQTFDASSLNPVDVNDGFILSTNAIFTAPSGNMTVAGVFTINAGTTYIHNGGTLVFDGTSSVTLTCNNTTFSLVQFNATSGTKTVSSDCIMPLGDDPTASRSIVLNGTFSGTGTLTVTSTFTLNSGSILSGFTGLINSAGSALTIATTLDAGAYSIFDVFDSFVLSAGGVFTAPVEMEIGNAMSLNAAAIFNHNNGTIIFDEAGSDGGSITCNNHTLNLVSFEHTGARITVSSTCDLPLGTDPMLGLGGRITVNGTLSGSGTLTYPEPGLVSDPFVLASNTALNGFSGLQASYLHIDGASNDFSDYDLFDIDHDLRLDNGAIMGVPTAEMTIGGNFSLLDTSIFNHNNGTVVLDGTDQTLAGTITFYNLTKNVSTAAILTFPSSTTITVEGELDLSGADSELLSLVSSTPTTQWQIDPQGTRDVDYVDVSDSENVNATDIVACNSVDSGNNDGWVFNPLVACDETTPTTPGQPTTPSPTTDTTPTWTWTASTDADSGLADPAYTVEWSQDETFASGVSSATTNTNSFTHSTALSLGTWYFRVKATDNNGNESPFSANGEVLIVAADDDDGDDGTGGDTGNGDTTDKDDGEVLAPFDPFFGFTPAAPTEKPDKDKDKDEDEKEDPARGTPTPPSPLDGDQPLDNQFIWWFLSALFGLAALAYGLNGAKRKKRPKLPPAPARLGAGVSKTRTTAATKTPTSAQKSHIDIFYPSDNK